MTKIFECTQSDDGHGRKLSNLHAYRFTIDGRLCASMEGFLQSLKTNDEREAAFLRTLSGRQAWKEGQRFTTGWQATQTLWWDGHPIYRQSPGYQNLLNRAYDALSENQEFRLALVKTLDGELTHSIGHHDTRLTVLTKAEFMYNLYRVRSKLLEEHVSK